MKPASPRKGNLRLQIWRRGAIEAVHARSGTLEDDKDKSTHFHPRDGK